jgi:hypothetical protein
MVDCKPLLFSGRNVCLELVSYDSKRMAGAQQINGETNIPRTLAEWRASEPDFSAGPTNKCVNQCQPASNL